MPQFMLLLHDDNTAFADVSPEEMQRIVETYIAWGNKLRASGLMAAGHKLADEPGKVVRQRSGQVRITDGPYSETKEVLGGFYIIRAANYDEAVAHSRDCPHLEYGGTIEVRQIDALDND